MSCPLYQAALPYVQVVTNACDQRVDVYYSIPHLYLPLLPPKDELLHVTDLQSPLLLNSIFALAAPYATFPLSRDYRTVAHTLLEQVHPATLASTSMASIHYVQSLLMLTYLEFGRANILKAVELCRRACEIVQRLGWNEFDAGTPPPCTRTFSATALSSPSPPHSTAGLSPAMRSVDPSGVWTEETGQPSTPGTSVFSLSPDTCNAIPPMGHLEEPTARTDVMNALMMSIQSTSRPKPSEDPIVRFIRISWWECWVTDIMMSVTCRQKRNLAGVMISVHLPSEPPCLREIRCPIVWVSVDQLL
jgi:hypothetical protein